MKKGLLVAFITVCSSILLSGCLEVSIDMGIDEWYRSYLSYSVVLDTSEVDPKYYDTLADAMNRLGWHYQEELGFTVGVNTSGDEYTLTMRTIASNNSLSDAFRSLKDMLTDENMSFFSQVDMSFESFERRESFVIDATLDLGHMLSISGADELPQDIQDALAGGIEASSGRIVLNVPVSEVETHSHDVDMQYRSVVMSVPLVFDGQTAFELHGSVVYSESGLQTGESGEIVEALSTTLFRVFIACGCALLLLLIILLARVIRVYKHNHLFD